MAYENCSNEDIIRASNIIKKGGVVIFPAKSLYGIAVDAFNPDAVRRVFEIKKRAETNPLLVLIDDISQIKSLIKPVSAQDILPKSADILIKKFWPGNITLIFYANPSLPKELTAYTEKIGVRVPYQPIARALVKAVGRPITGTSANISGQIGCKEVSELSDEILGKVDLVLDGGKLAEGVGSTVVDVTCNPVKILREGNVAASEIFKALSGFY
ncbi:MAG: threonylcarbamoyl-AMP synthase [Desulfamplus sp.]|nr:threonylcarbamoyl-AMP synthase [Desulfamplus sp.]